MSNLIIDLELLAELVVPPLLVVLAVLLDLRSRREFGLALLALAMVLYCLWQIFPVELNLLRSPGSEPASLEIALLLSFLYCGYLTFLLWIGAVVEVGLAGQIRWLIALSAEVVLAVLIVAASGLMHLGPPLFTVMGAPEITLILLVPMVTVLAYGVVRTARAILRPELEAAPGELVPAGVPQQSGGTHSQAAARSPEPVISVSILSAIMFLGVTFVIFLALAGWIRTPWHTFPAGTSPDTIGLAYGANVLVSIFVGIPAAVVAIFVGHVTLVVLRRVPHQPEGRAHGRVALTVLLASGLVIMYLAVAMQIYYWVMFELGG